MTSTRAAWTTTSKGCELRFEPWQPKVTEWLEQPDGAIELSLLDTVAARTRLGERVTGAKLAWTDPGLGVGVGPTTCEAIDDGGTKITCRGSSSSKTVEEMIAWLDKAFGAHAGPTVAASTPSAAFESDGTILAWNPTGPALAVKLRRDAHELGARDSSCDARRGSEASRQRARKQRGPTTTGIAARRRSSASRSSRISARRRRGRARHSRASARRHAKVDKCIEQMIPPLRHLLDTKLFVTR